MKKNPNINYISKVENVSMDDEWYEIAESSHFWFDWRLNAFLKQVEFLGLSKNHPYKVIEIGCGEGVLRKSIEEKTNWIVDAADLNISALEKVSPGKGKILLYNIFDEDDSLVGSYDIIILFDVLEHIFIADLPWVINDIFSKANKCVLINVACYESAALLPNGENAHITLRHPLWWLGQIECISSLHKDVAWGLFTSQDYNDPKFHGIRRMNENIISEKFQN